jgi:hypothetical protein
MDDGYRTVGGGLAVAVTLATIAIAPVSGQAPQPGSAARTPAARTAPLAKAYVAPKTETGAPDVSGLWNAATLTPLERPSGAAVMTEAEAQRIEKQNADNRARRNAPSNPNREAPPVGGDGSTGASGNVGGYNNFWVDPGDNVVIIDGERRTSIIVDPPDGRQPPRVARVGGGGRAGAGVGGGGRGAGRGAAGRGAGAAPQLQAPTSDAPENFQQAGRGAYDNMENRPLAERCLMAFSSSGGPPALPALYNNFKQIVQTKDHVVILNEMVHDVRIIRLTTKQHVAQDQRKWLGDSIGWYEGDTLVVETTNFTSKTRYAQSTQDLKVTERFRRLDDHTLLYRFTIDDPNTWTRPWTGEYTWRAGDPDDHLHEYACHEGNHSFGNIMRGARLLEKEAEEAAKQR